MPIVETIDLPRPPGPRKYRKKPVVIEAVQFTGRNDAEVAAFVGDNGYDPVDVRPTWMIQTLEGLMQASVGDFIIKGVKGEFYPCKPDIFEATYEEVGVKPSSTIKPERRG